LFKKGLEIFEVQETNFNFEKLNEDANLNIFQAVLSTSGKKLSKMSSQIPPSLKSETNCLIVPFEEKVYLIKPIDFEFDLQDVDSCIESEAITVDLSNSMN